MESLASKLRNGKQFQHAHNNGKLQKDLKHVAESLPAGGGKKRILGDITNRPSGLKGRPMKSFSVKEHKSLKPATKNITAVDPQGIVGNVGDSGKMNTTSVSSSKSSSLSSNEEMKLYTTAMEYLNDSAIDMSSKEEEDVEMSEPRPILPPGVEDFDASCRNDAYSVPDYAVDIFDYYRLREKKFPMKKYLHKQTEITKAMRCILVDWMVEVQESFELNHETLYLAVKLVDSYLMNNFVPKTKLQLIGATSVFISSKFDERMPPLVDDFLYICDDSYSRADLLKTEKDILKAIDFDLGIPLSYRFLRRYARSAKISMELLTLARFILETSLMDYDLIEILDSKLAAAALLLALKMKNKSWNTTLEYYSGYKESELLEIMVILNKDISDPPTRQVQTIRTKYSHDIFYGVAKIPPLNFKKVVQ